MKLILLLNWWNLRNQHEKTILKIGIYFIALIVFYYVFVLGCAAAVNAAEKKWNVNQALLDWMQPRVRFLQERRALQPVPISDAAMLASIQQSITRSNFATSLVKLTAVQNTAVEVQLKAVNFNQLLQWLGEENTKNGLITVQMSATDTQNPGIADVTFILDNPVLK